MTRRDRLFSKYYKLPPPPRIFAPAANVLLRLINGEAIVIWFD